MKCQVIFWGMYSKRLSTDGFAFFQRAETTMKISCFTVKFNIFTQEFNVYLLILDTEFYIVFMTFTFIFNWDCIFKF